MNDKNRVSLSWSCSPVTEKLEYIIHIIPNWNKNILDLPFSKIDFHVVTYIHTSSSYPSTSSWNCVWRKMFRINAHFVQNISGVHPEGSMPIKRSVITTPFPSPMQFQQAWYDVSLGGLGVKDRFVKTVNKSFSVITNGANRLAIYDYALLQQL